MTLTVGVVGLGYWGPNIARNLYQMPNVEVKYLCDLSEDLLNQYRPTFPGVELTNDINQLLEDDEVDAIALATPVPSHYPLGKLCLEAGKHTFIEKPLAMTTAEARELAELADDRELTLMVGHLLVYHPGVNKVRELIQSGKLGDVMYGYSHRLNLGKFRSDENALWSLGVHDVATLMYLTGDIPVEVTARGESYLHDGVEDVVFGNMKFSNGVMAHIHLSWLDPHKSRKLTIVGSQQMVVFDDMDPDRKITIYDKGFSRERHSSATGTSYGEYITKREGDISIPRLPNTEPLRAECEHFVTSVVEQTKPRSDGWDGVRVVQVLEAMQSSMEQGGASVTLDPAMA